MHFTNDDSHIITASTANKNLSFQGWEKCVEAFSQGKGRLSHHCTRLLSQPDSSQPDEAISWSSSDGECDESHINPQSRQRPTRQLTSKINFDDCKPVHSRGRRHTSAQFFRFIEKSHADVLQSNRNDLQSISYDQNMKVSRDKQEELCCSDFESYQPRSSSESYEDLLWKKNLSVLNQRINISDSCLEDLNDDSSEIPTLKSQGELEERSTSPILVPLQIRSRKKLRSQPRVEAKLEEKESNIETVDIPTSPIFKIKSLKKRRRQKCSEMSSDKSKSISESEMRLITSVNNSCPQDPQNQESNFSNLSENSNTNTSCLQEESIILPSQVSSKNFVEAKSPIVGRSSKKIPAKMIIDKSISPISKKSKSPILGSSTKPVHTLRRRTMSPISLRSKFPDKNTAHGSICETAKVNAQTAVDKGIGNLDHVSQLSILDSSENSKLCVSQSRNTAKRSLNFTHKQRGKVFPNDETSENADEGREASKYFDKNPFCQNKASTHEDHRQSFNDSNIIEEINTEQYDLDSELRKSISKNAHNSKKKKLSLSKKSLQKKSETGTKLSLLSESKPKDVMQCDIPGQKLPSYPSETFGFYQDCGNLLKQGNIQRGKEVLSTSTKPNNHTLLIEEEFSEPTEIHSQGSFVYAAPFPTSKYLKHNFTSMEMPKCSLANVDKDSSNQFNEKYQELEDIDCFSSPSIVESQVVQIEKPLSPCLPSPLTISQSSSPTAPVSIVSVEQINDDFNAPPKKGRKKLKLDGLAHRLQRLLNQQRSSSRIWQYKRSQQSRNSASNKDNHSSSLVLSVICSWTEYSHVIVQGHIDYDNENSSSCFKALSSIIILVLDPYVAEKLGRVMNASKLLLFPPWQALKLRGVSVILSASCIEVLTQRHLEPTQRLANDRVAEVIVSVQEDNAQGIRLGEIIFPKIKKNANRLLQYTEVNEDEVSNDVDCPASFGTISSIVSNHCVGGASSDLLSLTILRAFPHRLQDETENVNPAWSLLGSDTTGELCEVSLGYEDPKSSNSCLWLDVKTGGVIGKLYHFFGFWPVQRVSSFRVSSLWSVVSGIAVLGICNQSVLYVLAPTSSLWVSKSVGSEKNDMYGPKFTSLKGIFSEKNSNESKRFHVMCLLLHITPERMYIVDVETSPSITVIVVHPGAYIPVILAKPTILSILDLEAHSGELRADKYTRVDVLRKESMFLINAYSEKLYNSLVNMKPELPLLNQMMSAKSLVALYGSIVGVDEDSAFMWPACGQCGNELLSVGLSERYSCDKCSGQSDKFKLCMSLQVLVSCPNLPKGAIVRIKLLQKTIETLLPPSLCSEEGYDMNAVLGQRIGPLKCEIICVRDYNFTLQEIS